MPIQRANDRVEWIVSVKGRPGHWPAGSTLRVESGPPPEIFSIPGKYVRTGHSARTHIGRSSPGARFAEAPAAGLLEITARNCRLAAAARPARTDPGLSLMVLTNRSARRSG